MPPYIPPKVMPYRDIGKRFVRVGERLFIAGDGVTYHSEIAWKDRLSGEIERLTDSDPAQVDAGFIRTQGKELFVYGQSIDLILPVKSFYDRARKQTVNTFAVQSPEYTVVEF